ncbi:MAG: hypothetical protein GQ574_06910 [Crocinitomix sp.]|nr:hypothetical protein [Crocinitomix sp.]
MKLTKKKTKEFVNLVKDYKNSDIQKLSQYLTDCPELINLKIDKMAKGIDGFSPLMLAIRYLNFEFAKLLINKGANVNYIDESPVRDHHFPVFFDLIEIMRLIVESNNTSVERIEELFSESLSVWQEMEKNDLDYNLTTPETDIRKPENCLNAAIRLIGASGKYGNKHHLHEESTYTPTDGNKTILRISHESKNQLKEKMYKSILQKIIDKVDFDIIKSVDCSKHRFSSLFLNSFYEENGFIDSYALETSNELIRNKFNFDLNNYRGKEALKSLDENIERFANTM